VAEAALIGQPDEKWGEVGVMVIQLRPDLSATSEELLGLCAGSLAKFKIPKRVVFMESLPYSPYGKLMKSELKRQILGDKGQG
jgi:acyl-CoA synthetase (AMP-forming)/AMP-acid ligase II